MPAKNRIKTYISNSYYHIYNRGVEKRIIFENDQDYRVFLQYLRTYLLPKDFPALQAIISNPQAPPHDRFEAQRLLRMNNFSETISLISYCLMPNHFHLLIQQSTRFAMDSFMNSLCTRFTMYFNKSRDRVGPLFQGIYKAVLINTDEQLIHVTRYIHRNPISIRSTELNRYPYSSYRVYLESGREDWIKPGVVLSHFSKTGFNSYQSFVEDVSIEDDSLQLIKRLTLD